MRYPTACGPLILLVAFLNQRPGVGRRETRDEVRQYRRRIVYSDRAASPAITLAPTLTASRIGATGVVRW